jgi:aryl carrier-like protein
VIETELRDSTRAWVVELLDESDVSLEDNFLDLGGHSMLALRLNERIADRYGAGLSLRLLFERSLGDAVAELAARLRAA